MQSTVLVSSMFIALFFCFFVKCELEQREFTIDWENNQFLKDGQPFQYVSGSLHYFRIPAEYWQDRMMKMKAAGLNALQTYVEWRSHEPEIGQYNFDDYLDLFRFLDIAKENGLLVILRPGPYICAERDFGGLPYWLFKLDPSIGLRRSDPLFLEHVTRWFTYLFPKLENYWYHNGGPIIMAQIENEYGSYEACDFTYTSYLRDLMSRLTANKVVLFTTDGNGSNYLKCGKIDNVLATIDFGPGTNVTKAYETLRVHQKQGPLVNSEYYTGWLDHWSEPHSVTSTDLVIETLDTMLSMNISVNMYMFHGGTNFNIGAGSNYGTTLQPQPTSYDYDSPLNEAGDITEKYLAIRKVISKYFNISEIPNPVSPKIEFKVPVSRSYDFTEMINIGNRTKSSLPLTFEALGVSTGFVVYSTMIEFKPSDPALLTIPNIHDRAYIFVDSIFQGKLSRDVQITSLPINAVQGSKLMILVEHEGRINYGSKINEKKGIIGDVLIGPKKVLNWDHIYFSNMDSFLSSLVPRKYEMNNISPQFPAIFQANFTLDEHITPSDTFINLNAFTKGVVALNGKVIGKYWPYTGPQVTLYVPGVWLNPGPENNILTILEFEGLSDSNDNLASVNVQFQGNPVLNGTVPYSNVRQLDYWSNKQKASNLNTS